jgi:hypothetical protein
MLRTIVVTITAAVPVLLGMAVAAPSVEKEDRAGWRDRLTTAALASPCALVEAAFGTDPKNCFRHSRRLLRLRATLETDGKKLDLLTDGQTCGRGIVGVAARADSKASFPTYLDASFFVHDNGRISFFGNYVRWKPPCRGERCNTWVKGCYDVDGELALRSGSWRRVRDPDGCGEGK